MERIRLRYWCSSWGGDEDVLFVFGKCSPSGTGVELVSVMVRLLWWWDGEVFTESIRRRDYSVCR